MYWAFILLSALSYLAGTGFCLSCIHCTSNDGSGCSGIAKNCTGDTVCMSTVTQTATYTGQATTTLRRSCGEPQYCSAGSLSSYFITTVTNSTCCFTDSCTPPEPTMPNYKSKTKNGAVCKTCFARDERECSRFNTTMCTGSETFCVEYEVRTEAGNDSYPTILKSCSQNPEMCNISYHLSTTTTRMELTSSCCDTEFCNNDTMHTPSQNTTENGIECPSCFEMNADSCEANETIRCTGSENKCISFSGKMSDSEQGDCIPFALQGCATEDTCYASDFPLFPVTRLCEASSPLCFDGASISWDP
uniref:UPAR/Ly6 domain-containing protein n=1 Tax=Xenopus tropicalis TaxID=8364 RepID=A0A803KEJ2_XENTR